MLRRGNELTSPPLTEAKARVITTRLVCGVMGYSDYRIAMFLMADSSCAENRKLMTHYRLLGGDSSGLKSREPVDSGRG
jgi:hypothetical protein